MGGHTYHGVTWLIWDRDIYQPWADTRVRPYDDTRQLYDKRIMMTFAIERPVGFINHGRTLGSAPTHNRYTAIIKYTYHDIANVDGDRYTAIIRYTYHNIANVNGDRYTVIIRYALHEYLYHSINRQGKIFDYNSFFICLHLNTIYI